MSKQQKHTGFTLIEMLLVLVIASTILVMIIGYFTQKTSETRRERVIMQMQQFLNASMAYYVNNSTWPVKNGTCPVPSAQQLGASSDSPLSILQWGSYIFPPLPGPSPKNPWGNDFGMSCDTVRGQFWVYTNVQGAGEALADAAADALTIAGRLPLGYTANSGGVVGNPPGRCGASDTGCTYVVAFVTVPGQNLNNARSINYAGIYNTGGCVPAPVCPGNMKRQIFVTPSAVSGVNDSATPSNTYPISSFTAYAYGTSLANSDPTTTPLACGGGAGTSCAASSTGDPAGTVYWRVCLQVVTEKGTVTPSGTATDPNSQGVKMGSIMAVTRCAPDSGGGKFDIPSGSPFPYFQPN